MIQKIMNWIKKLLNRNKVEATSPIVDEPLITAIKVKPIIKSDMPKRRANQTSNKKSAPSWSYPTGTVGPSSYPVKEPAQSHGVSGTAGTSGVSGASGQSGTSGHAGTSNFTRYKQLIEDDGIFDDYVTDGIFDISAFDSFDVDL